MKTAFMEPFFTKWATKPFFLIVIDFIFSKTMSTPVVIGILIWMLTNLRIFFWIGNTECKPAYYLLIIWKSLLKPHCRWSFPLQAYVLEVFRGKGRIHYFCRFFQHILYSHIEWPYWKDNIISSLSKLFWISYWNLSRFYCTKN